MRHDQLFEADDLEDREPQERVVNNRCTPDLLLAFILRIGHMPTLQECKQEFGGILGPITSGWELQAQGRLPKKNKDGSIAREDCEQEAP